MSADWHLWPWIWSNRLDIRGDAYDSAKFIVGSCVRAPDLGGIRPPWLIVAGDLTDTARPPSEVVDTLTEMLDDLEEHGTDFGFIQGQHDMADPPWPTVHRHAQHLSHKTTVLQSAQGKQIKAFAMDWQVKPDLQHDLLNEIPEDCEILICHQVWDNFMGTVAECEGSFSDIPGHIKLLITGDYHKTVAEVYPNKDGNQMLVLSPGSTHMRSIDEEALKSYFVLWDDFSFDRVYLPTRPVIRPELLLDDDALTKFIGRLDDEFAKLPVTPQLKPLVHVHYSLDIENAASRLRRAVGEKGHLFLHELAGEEDEELVIAKEERRRRRAGGLLGCLPLVVDSDKEPELFADLNRLARCDNVKVELQTMKLEVMGDADVDDGGAEEAEDES